jgi:hypothetical protein
MIRPAVIAKCHTKSGTSVVSRRATLKLAPAERAARECLLSQAELAVRFSNPTATFGRPSTDIWSACDFLPGKANGLLWAFVPRVGNATFEPRVIQTQPARNVPQRSALTRR